MSLNIGIDIRPLMDKNYSGVGEYTLNFLQAIFEQDSKNRYFLFYNSAKGGVRDNLPKFNYKNVIYCGFKYPNKFFNLSLFIFGWPKIDKLIGEKYLQGDKLDLFFTPNINFTAVSKNCPHVVAVHDLSFEKFPEFYSPKGRLWHKIINFKKILFRASKIIAVSENTKKDIMEVYKINPDKIRVIYSGINKDYRVLEMNGGKAEKLKKEYGLPNKFILYLGNIEMRKNLESLILAFQDLDEDVSLVFAGGNGPGHRLIRNFAERSKKSNKIIFTGYLRREDKPYLYNLASAFVYPSYYEGFGFPPLEALACGIPVIAAYSSSLPEVVSSGAVLIDPFNVKDIELALQDVLGDAELRGRLQSEGFRIREKLSWRSSAENFLEILGSDLR